MLDSQRQQLATDGGETSSFAFTALGAGLALFHTEGRHGSSDAMVDLTTGIGVPPSRSTREYDTLDTERGHAGLCTPVRRTARRIEEPYTGSTRQLQAALQVSGWTVRWWPATALAPARRVILQRCGQQQSRKLTERASFFGPVLTRRYVAWLHVPYASCRSYAYACFIADERSYTGSRAQTCPAVDIALWRGRDIGSS